MSDLRSYETPVMRLDEFRIGLLEKDRIDGLLVRSDENGYYNIGIQINNSEVVKVDSALEDNAMEKIQYWGERVELVRRQYRSRQGALRSFDQD